MMSLRNRLQQREILVAPGVYDGLTSAIGVDAGFEALYLSGAAVAYTRLGRPDIGLTSVSEMADTMSLIADRVDVPVIIDADTGFGNALNAQRTMRLFERSGAAALQVEDQTFPKRCGHLKDKKLGSVYKSYAFMTCSFSNQRDRPTMDHKQFQDWLSGIDHLSPAQRQEAETVFMGVSEASSSLAAIEASVGESRQCPHCGTPGAISRGKARGLRRYQCKGCNKTFNAATGTPLSGLHRKDKWLAFGTCLSDGLTVRASAERCKFAVNTAFRWRHRFLTTDNPKARKLTGIVEVDETYVLQSQKGERNLERKARRRGGKARKRGLSDEQVPVLVAADRSGTTVSAVLPAVNADTLQSAIEPVVDDDIVLVTDGHRAYPPCAAALGVRHEALNLSGGERVRDAFHIQTVNNRHSQLKDFLRRYRGVATKYLDNYLRWFQRLQLENASPRACLATAIADPCIRFVN